MMDYYILILFQTLDALRTKKRTPWLAGIIERNDVEYFIFIRKQF